MANAEDPLAQRKTAWLALVKGLLEELPPAEVCAVLPALSDELLAAIVMAAGNSPFGHDAFEILWGRYSEPMLNAALAELRKHRWANAEDDAHEATERAWFKLWSWLRAHRYDPSLGKVKSCLNTIVHNEVISIIRHEGIRRNLPEDFDPVDHGSSSVDRLIEEEDAEHVRQVLESLPARYRDVLVMKYNDHMSVAEIATKMGRTVPQVYRLLDRARRAFRRRV